MNDKSFENIKEVLNKTLSKNEYKVDFLLKLLEVELKLELSDEDKIKYLKSLIDLEGKNVSNK